MTHLGIGQAGRSHDTSGDALRRDAVDRLRVADADICPARALRLLERELRPPPLLLLLLWLPFRRRLTRPQCGSRSSAVLRRTAGRVVRERGPYRVPRERTAAAGEHEAAGYPRGRERLVHQVDIRLVDGVFVRRPRRSLSL